MSDSESHPSFQTPSSPEPPRAYSALPRRALARADSGVSLGAPAGLSALSDSEDSNRSDTESINAQRRASDAASVDSADAQTVLAPPPQPDFGVLSLDRDPIFGPGITPIDTGSLVVVPETFVAGPKDTSLLARASRFVEKAAALGMATVPAGWALLVTVGLIYKEVDIFLE